MQSLILLLLRYGYVLLFLLLEGLCFYLIVQNNEYQKSVFLHSSNQLSGKMLSKVNTWKSYFSLQLYNDSLVSENARLKKSVEQLRLKLNNIAIDSLRIDSSHITPDSNDHFEIIPARVVNNTIHLQNNYMTLNKGARDGIAPRMGVIAEQGVVGVVEHVSDHYATVLPFLNARSRIRGMLLRNQAIGSVAWDGKDINYLVMDGIPKHLSVQTGDTVVTSGYSTIFPEGQMIGTVTEVSLPRGSNTYLLKVKTPVSMANLPYVYIIKNNHQPEILELESKIQ